jgi:hypothetical protein
MNNQLMKILAVIAGAALASGCSTMAADSSGTMAASDSASKNELVAAQSRVSQLESELATRNRQLAEAEESRFDSIASSGATTADASLFPPNPKTGECYARVLIPATYKSVSEQIMTSDAAERIEIIPARYETVEETVLVREASTKLEIVPAVYGEVQEQVIVKPASTRIVHVPAEYDTVTEKVLDRAAHTAWKKGPAATQSSNVLSQTTTDTGEIMCLIEVPATYKTVQKRVLVRPARTDEVALPAEYKTVTKTVVKQPATTREIVVPAQYDTVTVTKLVSPSKENRIAIPASYETVTRNDKVSDERVEWRRVVCETNMTRSNVMALQRALADKGYYKAGVDGIIGAQTLGAARSFAIDNNLPSGSNYVPIEVVEKLNLSL